ncbi:MAG: hypothetical protein JSU85_13980 [Candidatus Zixiibacteriota bacterium]|nr:MAG: hypothetical protein JSU85_13980 [candidate division Zixibacteria bacterium]
MKKDIAKSIVDNDCFGIRSPLLAHEPIPPQSFAFERDVAKLNDFMKWLESEQAKGILEIIHTPGSLAGGQSSWMNKYIDSAYLQGLRRARAELRRAGFDLSRYGIDPTAQASILAAFHSPVHVEAVAMLYTRIFEDLKTVTSVMNSQIRRELAEALRTGISRGFAEGQGAETIARGIVKSLNGRVDAIGINRSRMITRTEIIRAHHLSNISEYRQMAEDLDVTVKAEFTTAGSVVCPECASLEGKIYKLSQIEGLIPVHPNCRCVAVPYIEGVTNNMKFKINGRKVMSAA